MDKLKENIEHSLIELIDDGYKVKTDYGTWLNPNLNNKNSPNKRIFFIDIKTPLFQGLEIEEIKEYLHQCYDFMKISNYELFNVNIDSSKNNVRKIDKEKGKLIEGELKVNNWEELWDSIDFYLFSTPNKNIYYSIKLDFILQ